jgi:hypothetical protein
MYGDRPDPVTAATTFVAQRFPEASAAFLGAGVLSAHRTPTSDLDVVVLLPGPPAPFRETFEHEGWIVEAFAHTAESLETFWARDAARRVPSLIRMCAEGVVLADAGQVAADVQARAAALLAAGPSPPTVDELAWARYGLTDLLDDMAGCDDEAELVYIAGGVVRQVSELALLVAGRWSGSGKGLARQLKAHDPDLLERLLDGHRHVVVYGDTAVLHRAAVDVLMRAGGALLAGFRADGGSGRADENAK